VIVRRYAAYTLVAAALTSLFIIDYYQERTMKTIQPQKPTVLVTNNFVGGNLVVCATAPQNWDMAPVGKVGARVE